MPKVSDEHRAAQRHRIQQAAIAVARRKGVQAATMGEIITESGLSAGAIYGYYASKDELMIDLARTVMGSRLGIAQALVDANPVPSPAEALGTLVGELPEEWLEGGLLLQFWGVAATQPQIRATAQELGTTMTEVIGSYLRAWYGQSMPEREADERAARATPALLALAQGFVMQRSIGLMSDFAPCAAAVRELVGDTPH